MLSTVQRVGGQRPKEWADLDLLRASPLLAAASRRAVSSHRPPPLRVLCTRLVPLPFLIKTGSCRTKVLPYISSCDLNYLLNSSDLHIQSLWGVRPSAYELGKGTVHSQMAASLLSPPQVLADCLHRVLGGPARCRRWRQENLRLQRRQQSVGGRNKGQSHSLSPSCQGITAHFLGERKQGVR